MMDTITQRPRLIVIKNIFRIQDDFEAQNIQRNINEIIDRR